MLLLNRLGFRKKNSIFPISCYFIVPFNRTGRRQIELILFCFLYNNRMMHSNNSYYGLD